MHSNATANTLLSICLFTSSSGWQTFSWNSCYVKEFPFIDTVTMTSNLSMLLCNFDFAAVADFFFAFTLISFV